MSESCIQWVYKQKVGNNLAKFILAYLAYNNTCSIAQIATYCETTIKKVINALNFLIENNFISRRDGYIESSHGNIYQYSINNRK
jgi:DNA-binding MarR family transcriptional regulator